MPTDPMWCFENYGEAAEYIDQLEKQRDELLAALDAIISLPSHPMRKKSVDIAIAAKAKAEE